MAGFLKGKTVAELASRISMEPQVLEETIRRFNKMCQTGKDAGLWTIEGRLARPGDPLLCHSAMADPHQYSGRPPQR